MRYRQLGRSDLRVSEVGLGGNTFGPPRLDEQNAVKCIHAAHDSGVNFIDTALVYGGGQSEKIIGKAIAGRREEWILATKFHLRNMRDGETVRSRILSQCDESLGKLGVDHIDLLQVHMPAENVPLEEILEPLAQLANQGKLRWIGECNFAAWRHAEALKTAELCGLPPMISAQNHFNLLHRHMELEMLPFCEERGVGFLPYHPLAGGFLTDKYVKGKPAPEGTRGAEGSPIVRRMRTAHNEEIQERLKLWAHANGRSLGELAIAWLLSHSQVTSVIAGVSTPEQVELNARAADWTLTLEEKKVIEEISFWDGANVTV